MNNKAGIGIGIGIIVTVLVHAALALGYVAYRASDDLRINARLGDSVNAAPKEAPLLCGKRRCRQMEKKKKRRDIEPAAIETPEILEASMIPALGNVDPDVRKLPEIQTYERPEIFEAGVNLEEPPSDLEKIITRPDPKEALKDPRSKSVLDKILDEADPDPRARARDLSRLTGFKEGEVGGQGTEKNLGNVYGAKVTREIAKVFKVPPFLDAETLKKLQVRVQVLRLGFDGAIEDFRIVSKSIDRSYDDAALAAIKQFVSKEGGQKRFPVPEPEVLRFINTKGLTITLDGRLMRR